MKSQILVGLLGWSMSFAACASRYDAGTSSVESSEIGICGANADPSTGVTCKHTYTLERGPFFSSSEIFERKGFDFVRCTFWVQCDAVRDPRSTGNEACLSVIGTGCPFSTLSPDVIVEVRLPPGTPADNKDQVCQRNVPGGQRSRATCTALNDQVEQGEDLCCLPRVEPPPGDGGVGADAGSETGSDATVDAGSDAGADAGVDADSGVDAGVDADSGVDAGVDADSGADSGVDAGSDADSGVDAGLDADSGFVSRR